MRRGGVGPTVSSPTFLCTSAYCYRDPLHAHAIAFVPMCCLDALTLSRHVPRGQMVSQSWLSLRRPRCTRASTRLSRSTRAARECCFERAALPQSCPVCASLLCGPRCARLLLVVALVRNNLARPGLCLQGLLRYRHVQPQGPAPAQRGRQERRDPRHHGRLPDRRIL